MSERDELITEWRRHLRLAILRALSVAPQRSLNDSILHSHLTGPRLRFKCSRDQVREQMEWLAGRRLVTAEAADEDGLVIAMLTDDGDDIVQGNASHRDIANPRR